MRGLSFAFWVGTLYVGATCAKVSSIVQIRLEFRHLTISMILQMTRRTRFIRLCLCQYWCQSVSRNFGKK